MIYERLSGAFSVQVQKLLSLIKPYKVSFSVEIHGRRLCYLSDVSGYSFRNAAIGNGAYFQADRWITLHFA